MLNRRTFVQMTAGSLATTLQRPILGASVPDRSFEHGSPLREFAYRQVAFAPCLQQSQLEQTHAILMGLDDDSLLRPFRLRAGLRASGCNLGGWYSSEEMGGETFGQWISALSRYYAIGGDEASRAKVKGLLEAFAQTIEPQGKIFGDPKLTGGAAYLFDKLTCGLIDAYEFLRYPEALEILDSVTRAVVPQLPGRALDQLTEHDGANESYTIPENQFIVWQRGGAPNYLELARQYLYHSFFDPLARDEDVLAGRHPYSHVNALCSAAKAYMVLGDERYLRAARNGFSFVEKQSFATGGWGPDERFVPSSALPEHGRVAIRTLADSLTRTHSHFETPCGAYAHFKLTRYLLRITRDPSYGDSMERVMYNTVLGAKNLQPGGRAFYYSDYNPDGRKVYFDGVGGQFPSEWPCCSGTLPQVAADYRISTYFQDADGVFANLYIPSTLKWQHAGTNILLSQAGYYPLSDTVRFELRLTRPIEFALRLRIPVWAQQPAVYLNGRRITRVIEPGTFWTLRRTWRSGDSIELELPKLLELTSVDSAHPDLVAVTYGPLVLFAVSEEVPRATRAQLLSAERQGPRDPDWIVSTNGGTFRLTPFWQIKNERYSTYLWVA